MGGLWTEQIAARVHYAPKVRLLLASLGIEKRRVLLTKGEIGVIAEVDFEAGTTAVLLR